MDDVTVAGSTGVSDDRINSSRRRENRVERVRSQLNLSVSDDFALV